MMLVHIEDTDSKARAIARLIERDRPDLRLIRVHRADQWTEALMAALDHSTTLPWAGVITDWSFPKLRGQGPVCGAGETVLAHLHGTGLPRIVLSGEECPVTFRQRWGGIPWVLSTELAELRAWLRTLRKGAGT